MRFPVVAWVFFVFTALISVSCEEAERKGTFSLDFVWGDDRPDAGETLYVWGQVFRVQEDARIAVEDSPIVPFDTNQGTLLVFENVPNGESLMLTVAFTADQDKESLPLYFGESKTFALEPGRDTVVSVEVSLSPAPALVYEDDNGQDVAFSFLGTTGPATCSDCYAASETVGIRFESLHAAQVVLSNFSDFPEGKRSVFELDDLEQDESGAATIAEWNLNEGLEDIGDGQRTVYMKLVHSLGYESGLYRRSLTLDTEAPADAAVEAVDPLVFAETPEDLAVEMIFAVVGEKEMIVEACSEGCTEEEDRIDGGIFACSSNEERHCLSAVEEWIPFETSGWISFASDEVKKVRVKFRDWAHNETDWVVFAFDGVALMDLPWVDIPGGTFTMGCVPGDGNCYDEYPVHTVTISPFQILAKEVTYGDYRKMTGHWPSNRFLCTEDSDNWDACPGFHVSWYIAKSFCLSIGGRLPSESEWEYAARAETTTIYPCGNDEACLDEIAWYMDNSDIKGHIPGLKKPNDFGLYDMIGNASEWVEDCLHMENGYNMGYQGAPNDGSPWVENCHENYKITRGGDIFSSPHSLASSRRNFLKAGDTALFTGFRCVRDYEP